MSNSEIVLFEQGAYQLLFDLPTPRPHFIITRKIKEKSKNQLKCFLENPREIHEVLKLCIQFLNSKNGTVFKGRNIIFSLHTGFFSSSEEFHAHLSVDLEQYKKVFSNLAPSSLNGFKPTKQWNLKPQNADVKQAYILNIDDYSRKELNKYKEWKSEDIKTIENSNFCRDPKGIEELKKIKDADIIMHPSLPKIGFKLKTGNIDEIEKLCQTLLIMKEYSENKGYFQKSGGSHLCLILNNMSSFDVNGYILTTGSEYYKLFDEYQQVDAKKWKDNFIKEEYFVET